MTTASNVLITCGGKWVGVVLQFKRAMRDVPPLRDGKIFVADRESVAPAGHWADKSFVVPRIDDAHYVDRLLEICRRHEVRVLVPLIEIDVLRLTHHRARFGEVGTSLVCTSPEFTQLCFDKTAFEEFARSEEIPVPRRFHPDELDGAPYPLFYKLCHGFGSLGSGVCYSPQEAERISRAKQDVIFQEYFQAQEVSVDAFIASTGACTVRVQRIRDKVVDGEVARAHTVKLPKVRQTVSRTIDALSRKGLRGPVTVQVFSTEEPAVIDVNPRLGSGNVLSNIASRGRLHRSILAESCGLPTDGDPDDYDEGVCLYRYLGDTFHNGKEIVQVFP